MWGVQYDEDLHSNPFFAEISSLHGDLLQRASQENWIICVPRVGVLEPDEITIDAICDHILVSPSQDKVWYTLSKKQVCLQNREVKTLDRPAQAIRILFEETFYLENKKYLVFCLDRPLFVKRPICADHKVSILETLDDCIDFLWSENLSHVLIRIQGLCAAFSEQNRTFAMENLQSQTDLIGSLYSQCLQIVLAKRDLTENCENVKIAVETYMQSCLDRTLIRAVNTATCFSDSTLNKILRNASDLQLKDLNIPLKYCDVITSAKAELCKINNYVTILDKVNCLKLTFSFFKRLTSDDLLQILVLLIIKLNIANWTSNLVYLTHFQFSSLNVSNENNFLVTSLEAALEFIKSPEFAKVKPKRVSNPIFQSIIADDVTLLKDLMQYKNEEIQLCHPLCDCTKCNGNDSSRFATINEKGQTLLTFATIMGRPEMVEFLTTLSDINAADYCGRTALHYACLKGHQDVLLILTNCKADFTVKDNDGNTALHLACNNGHENCVKALFYTLKDVDVDCVNKHGDTALHLAVKWNFVGIVRLLVENNAVTIVPNKRNQLPVHLAQNYYTERLLHQNLAAISEKVESSCGSRSLCKEHGIKAKGVDQLKKIDLLLKAIENNDLPLSCFYLGFAKESANYSFETKCHPLCNCEKCDDCEASPQRETEKINVNTCNIDGFTPLHFAAKYGRVELLRILLDSRAQPNLKTYKTLQTPLHLACINQRLGAVKELAKCGDCELDAQDYKGNTPLYYACMKNDSKIVDVLLSNGANADIQNYQGSSVIKEAQERSLFGVSSLLKVQNEDFL